MKQSFGLFMVLASLWLLLSGFFEPLLLGLGLASCLFVVFIARRMDVVDHEERSVHMGFTRLIAYWIWLLGEIIKASIDVTRRILDPKMPISPTVFKVAATQANDLGLVTYANSITLTPGTISIDINDKEITVHALSREAAQDVIDGAMDQRVTALDISH